MTFSRFFPAHHPKKGQPTEFVEKIWESLYPDIVGWSGFGELCQQFNVGLNNIYPPKHHTIRAGNRWKVGDWFVPKVWGDDVNPKSGRKGPYHSKQITIGPPIEVKRVWDFELRPLENGSVIFINDKLRWGQMASVVAKNDGLSVEDFKAWFKWGKPFKGQIICWNDQIEY